MNQDQIEAIIDRAEQLSGVALFTGQRHALARALVEYHAAGTLDIVVPLPEAPKGRREVEHVEAEEDNAPTPYVWLYRNMLTELQAVAPLGRDEANGQYAVAVDQLTIDQMAVPHVKKQLEQMHVDIAAHCARALGDTAMPSPSPRSAVDSGALGLAQMLRNAPPAKFPSVDGAGGAAPAKFSSVDGAGGAHAGPRAYGDGLYPHPETRDE